MNVPVAGSVANVLTNLIHGMVERYKPTLEALAATHTASDEDYERLAVAVVRAITLKQRDLLIKFPYFVKLPDSFPKGILQHKDEQYNYYRCKTFRLADWLFEHNHLAQNAKDIVKSQRTVVNLFGSIERLVANPEDIMYNDVIDVDEDMPR